MSENKRWCPAARRDCICPTGERCSDYESALTCTSDESEQAEREPEPPRFELRWGRARGLLG